MNNLKGKLLSGQNVIGPFCKITDPAAIEIAGLAGFDFVIIDMEHGPVSFENAQNLIRAAQLRGISAVIRVPENRDIYIQRALDIGANAVQVPQVSTVEDARRVSAASKFHPHGNRGVCRFVKAAGYSAVPKHEYFSTSNEDSLTLIHIEGIDGINNLGDIVKADGIDLIFLGPYDLSQSCGVPGQVDHPLVIEKMTEAVNIAKENGKFVGTFVESAESASKWAKLGVQYLSFSVDVGILMSAYKEIVQNTQKYIHFNQ